jgi:UPF0271 protein
VGAHPSFPDRVGFGRRLLAASPDEVRDDVTYQLGALLGFCRAEGVALRYVKPHGALYNAAAEDPALATAICEAARAVDPDLWILGLAGSRMVEVARGLGLRCAGEAFADRSYTPAGALVSRRAPGALIHDAALVADRVVALARGGAIAAADGTALAIDAQSVCLHGDTPGAAALAVAIRARRRGPAVRDALTAARLPDVRGRHHDLVHEAQLVDRRRGEHEGIGVLQPHAAVQLVERQRERHECAEERLEVAEIDRARGDLR